MVRNRGKFGSRKGQAFTEWALVFGPLLFFIVGIIDTGMALWVRSTLQNAARAGASYAINYTTQKGLGQMQSIKNIVKQNSMGLLDNEDITVAFFQGNNPSVVGRNAPDNIVVVTAERNWIWLAKAITSGDATVTLRASSADRLESLRWNQTAPAL